MATTPWRRARDAHGVLPAHHTEGHSCAILGALMSKAAFIVLVKRSMQRTIRVGRQR